MEQSRNIKVTNDKHVIGERKTENKSPSISGLVSIVN